MTKIAYNRCFGGFSLSKEAILRGREISGDPLWGGVCLNGDANGTWACYSDTDGGEDLNRADPVLIQVIEELGEKANGECASLAIEDLPEGTAYRIEEYDGFESVMTRGDYDWAVA